MEGRCVVETWTEFGFSSGVITPWITSGLGTDVLICTGREEVLVFNTQERQLRAVLQFPDTVRDLVQSPDKQFLYVSCVGGVYCVSVPSLESRDQSAADESPNPSRLKISSDFLVVGEEGASSVLLVDSVLLILSQRDASWLLSLYKVPKKAQSSSYEMLSSFSVPQVSADAHGDTETGVKRRPVLICLHSFDPNSPSSSSPPSSERTSVDSDIFLDSVLFKLLFGIDAALAKRPIILCGLPDGRLCFLPLRLPGSRLRVLHSLEQPVVYVGASVAMETEPGPARCLVAVGEQGRVVLMKTDKGGPEGGGYTASFIEGCAPGPVVCGFVDKHHLYYSTGSDLLDLDLSQGCPGRDGGQGREEETSRKTAAGLQSPTSLNVCRVTALAAPAHNTAAGEVQLLGLTVRGQLQSIVLPEGTKEPALSRPPSTPVGRSIRDLLSAIGDVCERVSVLKTAIKSKNHILKQLNQVLSVSFLLVTGTDREEPPTTREKPIRCRATTGWSRLLQKDSLNLTCVLENSSPYILDGGWTLVIAVFPVSFPPSAGEESSSTNFSFPFHSLHPGEVFEASLPLASAGDTSFPVRVSCSLVFSLSCLLGEEEEEVAQLLGGSRCLSLPLNTLTVDWLDVLQVESPTTHPVTRNATSPPSNISPDTVQAFLSSRRSRCTGRREGGLEGEREEYSASVQVSSELLRDTWVSHVDPQGSKVAPQNLCPSLLDWLLSEGPGGEKTGRRGDKIVLGSSVVHARCPNGDVVKLSAKEVNLGDESPGTIEVRVDSSSLEAVCGLHHAVLSRVQLLLLQSVPERAASARKVQSLGLRQALQRAERLLQQIQQSRISGAFGAGMSTGQTTQSLLSVYRELRENPLPII